MTDVDQTGLTGTGGGVVVVEDRVSVSTDIGLVLTAGLELVDLVFAMREIVEVVVDRIVRIPSSVFPSEAGPVTVSCTVVLRVA